MRKYLLFVLLSLLAARGIAQVGANSLDDSYFFPIAVWAQDPAHASVYKANGINLYINIYGGLNQEKLDQLKKASMRVIAHQNSFGLTRRDEPLLYGWINGDEPDNAQRNVKENTWDPCLDPADLIRDYERIKKNDPSRPVYLNVGPGVAHTNWIGRGTCRGRTDLYMINNNGYLKACDIASFHIYPVNSHEAEVKDNLWYVAHGIDNLREWSNNTKPVWCWIETTRITERSTRKPTVEEVKAQVWMALIHGAKGFGYFCHSFVDKTDDIALLHDTVMLAAVKAINEQVAGLARVLHGPDTKGYASVRSNDRSVPVDILTKRDGKVNYLFAVAMREGETNITFKVKSGKKAEVIGENRTIEIKKGKFMDHFARYGVHLYKITK